MGLEEIVVVSVVLVVCIIWNVYIESILKKFKKKNEVEKLKRASFFLVIANVLLILFIVIEVLLYDQLDLVLDIILGAVYLGAYLFLGYLYEVYTKRMTLAPKKQN